jgi:chorismate lyase/3-hydroxybenzoate synthase
MNRIGKLPLRACYERAGDAAALASDPSVLAWFEFGQSPLASTEPRHVPVALPQLGGEPVFEVWRTVGPVESGTIKRVRYARNGALTMGHIVIDLRQETGIREASRIAYDQLQSFLEQSAHHWPLKIWNYIPAINAGDGDSECYRQFCIGRSESLAAGYGDQPSMPAATAIGAPAGEPALQVYFLAGALPGLNVENPRQVNAWQYPRHYGPRSPLFSRGTVMEIDGVRQFLISGTASVIGHETHHQDDVQRQALESWRNVRSLIKEGHRLLGKQPAAETPGGILKIYVRDPGDLETIRDTLEKTLPDGLPRLFLTGDVCRSDLLTEMDGVVNFD